MDTPTLLECSELLFAENCLPLSLRLLPGGRLTLLVADDESAGLLLQTLVGRCRPLAGARQLFDSVPETLSETGRRALRRRIGVIADRVGLISNLTVLENLLLPVEYLGGDHQRLQQAARDLLLQVGFRGEETLLPGHLRLLQKRQVLLARALLAEPELLIYDDVLTGLSARERSMLLETIRGFQAEHARSANLFLTSDIALADRFGTDEVCNLIKGESL